MQMLTDWRGNTYGPGDAIIYATAQSSSITMCEGTVLEIGEEERYGRPSKWVKVQKTREHNGRTDNYGKPYMQSKITAVERITKVT